jgi:hypothetical protein
MLFIDKIFFSMEAPDAVNSKTIKVKALKLSFWMTQHTWVLLRNCPNTERPGSRGRLGPGGDTGQRPI